VEKAVPTVLPMWTYWQKRKTLGFLWRMKGGCESFLEKIANFRQIGAAGALFTLLRHNKRSD